jgi:hypothetical protein
VPNSLKREEIPLRLNVMSAFTEMLSTNAVELECVRAIFTADYECGINRVARLLAGGRLDSPCVA